MTKLGTIPLVERERGRERGGRERGKEREKKIQQLLSNLHKSIVTFIDYKRKNCMTRGNQLHRNSVRSAMMVVDLVIRT